MFKELTDTVLGELEAVFARMQEADVRPLLEAIKSAPRVFLLGAGREGLATRAFAMRLMHLGKAAYWIWDDTTPAIGPGDLMGHENYIAQQAKNAGADLALITPAGEGYLLGIADIVTRVPAAAYKAKGDFVPSEQLMGNLFEQTLFLLYDILVMQLRQELGVSAQEMVARHRNVE